MGNSVQSICIGDTVYVGGGDADSGSDRCTVMKLVQYSARFFAMTSLANQLVLVGGWDPVTQKQTSQIGLFASGRWTSMPPMNIARSYSTAVCFNNSIIVAGGLDDQARPLSSVEIMDVISRKWYIAKSLPIPRCELKSTLIGNTIYLMGGCDHTGD